MKSSLFNNARRFLFALGLASAPAFATPLMDMRAEDLLPMAQEMKKSLGLNANQQLLWQQVETRSRAILRERQSRRERLQHATRAALDAPKVELRDLAPAIEAESDTSAAEARQLRELWLGVNDALDERQRQQVAALAAEQMMRVQSDGAPRSERPREEGGQRGHGGMGRGKPGGGGTMPSGAGMPGS